MTEQRNNGDKIGWLYKEIGNADDRYVEEMLDERLAKKIKNKNAAKHRRSALAYAAAAVAICAAAAYPILHMTIAQEKSSDTAIVSDAEKEIAENGKADVQNNETMFGVDEKTMQNKQIEQEDQAAADAAEDIQPEQDTEMSPSTDDAVNNEEQKSASDNAGYSPLGGLANEYPMITGYADSVYVAAGVLSEEHIGEPLGDCTAQSEDGRESCDCRAYAIEGISDEAAIAVSYDGETQFYYCINSDYPSEKKEDLIAELDKLS